MKKEDRKIILEIYTLKSRENILGEYEIYNGELKNKAYRRHKIYGRYNRKFKLCTKA